MKDWMSKNEHGVFGFAEMDIFIPQCCFNCRHYDGGEYGDYGVILSRPYCLMGLFFPTRKGDCKREQQSLPNNANCTELESGTGIEDTGQSNSSPE